MKDNLLCFQMSGRLIKCFAKHSYYASTNFTKENKQYKKHPGFLLAVRSAGIYQEQDLQLFKLQKIKPNAVEIERLYRISTKHFMNDYSFNRMPLSNGKVRPNQVNLAITKKLR